MDLRISGTVIDLDPKTKVRIVKNNTMFVDDFLDVDYTYPFFIPGTDFNKNFFGHPEKPEAVRQQVEYAEVEVRDEGNVVLRGTLYIQRASDEGYQAYVLSGMGELSPIKDTLLKDIDLGGSRPIGNGVQEMTFNITNPASTYHHFKMFGTTLTQAWPISGFGGMITGLTSQINATTFYAPGVGNVTLTATWGSGGGGFWIKIVADWSGVVPLLSAQIYSAYYTGSPHHSTVVATGISGATAVKEAWEDLMNDVTDVSSSSDFLFFPVLFREPAMRDVTEAPAVIFDNFYANYAEDGEFKMDYKAGVGAGGDSVQTAPLPFVKSLYVLRQILKSVNLNLTGDFTEDDDIKNLVLFNNTLLLKAPFSIASFDDSPYQSTFDLKNHVPQQKTVSDFLVALRKCFAIAFYFDNKNKVAEILTLNEMLDSTDAVDYSDIAASSKTTNYESKYKGYKFKFSFDGSDALMTERVQSLEGKTILPEVNTVADLSSLDHSMNNLCYVVEENAYYYPEYNSSNASFLQWSYYSDNLNELDVDDAETEIDSGSDTLIMWKLEDTIEGGGKEWRIPLSKSLPNVPDFFQTGYPDNLRPPTEIGIRFLFFRGWTPDSLGDDYPLGSHDEKLVDGSDLSPISYNMQWDGANGLYYKAWAKFTAWMRDAREVEMSWFFTHLKWLNIDMRKKAFVNGVHYFIKSIEQEFPITAPAKVTLMKIAGASPDPALFIEDLVLVVQEQSNSSNGVDCDARIVLLATGGVAPYLYNFEGSDNLDGIYDNICPGTYIGHVIDDNGTEATVNIIIT